MAYCEESQFPVVFHLEGLAECSNEVFQFLFLMVETEGKHQGGGLDDVGVDVEFVASGKDEPKVMFVHERIVTRGDGDQGLVVLDDVGGDFLDAWIGSAVDDAGLVLGMEKRLNFEGDILVL